MKWISVKERLPSKYGYYLTYNSNGKFVSKFNAMNIYRYYPKKKTFWWFGVLDEVNDDITHWMPLPRPPIDEDENEMD